MNASSTSKVKPSYYGILDLLTIEFMTNQEKYKDYFYDGADIESETKKFLKDKSYSRQIGDMIINALANVTLTAAVIWVKESDGSFIQTNYITPDRESLNGIVHVLKMGQHYEPIVDIDCAGIMLYIFLSRLINTYSYFRRAETFAFIVFSS